MKDIRAKSRMIFQGGIGDPRHTCRLIDTHIIYKYRNPDNET